MITEIVFRLILLHGPEGHEVWINPEQVVSMRPKVSGTHFQENAHCYITLGDGKFAAVRETCEVVRRLGEER